MLDKIALFLSKVKGVIYVTWYGERLPISANSTLNLFSLEVNEQFVLSPDQVPEFLSLLRIITAQKKLIVIFFDVKPLLSYAGWSLEKQNLSSNILSIPDCNDLMVRERFLGISLDPPKSCKEAILRLKKCDSGREVYKKVHFPLFHTVAFIERSCLIKKLDDSAKKVYPVYEIEGQANGRLNCKSYSDNNYNPHLMDEEVRKSLLPLGYDRSFILADFKSLEFSVLAHISQDENMIFDTKEKDPYLAGLKRMFGKEVPDNYRETAKDIFLPVFYGETPPALARNLQCSIEFAEKIFNEIKAMYPKASRMVVEAERYASQHKYYKDCLGRIRYFESKFLAARNMSVQAPSAMFCQEKLNHMFSAVRVGATVHASIHDGFLLSCKNSDVKEISSYVKMSLESPSEILPGLSVPIKISSGSDLENLSEIV